ncbi:MAG: methylated-DNA--[protein]-cysteine S-methyltransferase [Cyanobacteria bacterium J06639_1]
MLSTPDAIQWQAVLTRDRAFDGRFVYGVRSTKIYCRPTCPSRRPRRDRVLVFPNAEDAERAGFRACKRCHPQNPERVDALASKITATCRDLERAGDRLPTLSELASRVDLSPSYLQREFKRKIGISPFQYGRACRAERFKQTLQAGTDILSAAYDAGYSSSSQLYDRAEPLGLAPSAYQQRGSGVAIEYTTFATPLGWVLVAASDRGLCSVRLGDSAAALEAECQQEFARATLQKTTGDRWRTWVEAIAGYLNGDRAWPLLPYDVRATAFQARVWEALRSIPAGRTLSYSEVAEAIGQPTATRAVARACATNPVALIVPCHRVVPKNGKSGNYRWGRDRKQALLDLEQTNSERSNRSGEA